MANGFQQGAVEEVLLSGLKVELVLTSILLIASFSLLLRFLQRVITVLASQDKGSGIKTILEIPISNCSKAGRFASTYNKILAD